jgi:methionine biosynthesis protein MetW
VFDQDEVTGIAARLIPAGARVLDVGCGTGSLTRLLADNCTASFVGVEPDALRAAKAASLGLEIYTGYLTPELIRQIGQFDVVLFADVLEHLSNPYSELLRARDALRPGGSVILSVPNVAHWSVRTDLLRGRFRYQPSGIMDATHLRWFTANGIRGLVTSAGFRVIYYGAAAGTGLEENVSRWPLSWLPRKVQGEFLRKASRHWPTLFGCQHVLKAEPA